MTKQNAIKIIEILKELYPDAKCSLDFHTPFEMLVAVCLSAQCTDERVNKVTKTLFNKVDELNTSLRGDGGFGSTNANA